MENPHSIFEQFRQGAMFLSFHQKKFDPTLYQFFFKWLEPLSFSLAPFGSFTVNYLMRKEKLLFHWFLPSFLCDLIISRFLGKYNWHSVWNFRAVFVQWGELCPKNKIGGLQVNIFVIYWKCWGLEEGSLFFVWRNGAFKFWFIRLVCLWNTFFFKKKNQKALISFAAIPIKSVLTCRDRRPRRSITMK